MIKEEDIRKINIECKEIHVSRLCNQFFFHLLEEYSKKKSNDILTHSVEFSNVHNCDRSSNATQSNLAY